MCLSATAKKQALADAMRDLLKDNGIKTWMAPGDIPAGSKYAQVINQAVKECACFILMLSKDAQNSVWVAKEVERAINYRKHIIPVQIEKVVLNDEFELYISTDQVVAIQKIDKQSKEIQNLLNIVASLTGAITAPPPKYTTELSSDKSEEQSTGNCRKTKNIKSHPILFDKIQSLFNKPTVNRSLNNNDPKKDYLSSVSQAMQMVSAGLLNESADYLYKLWAQYYN